MINKREKILIGVVVGICGLFAAGFAIKAVVVQPLREWDRKSAALREKLEKIRAERREYFAAEDKVKVFTERTFDLIEDQVSAKSGERLTRMILQSGLSEADFTRVPLGPRLLRSGLKTSEVGWSVQGEGRLEHVINLLFLLQESPYVRRIEGLSFSSAESPGRVRVRFRYLTVVINPAPTVTPIDLQAKYTLESPERRIFDSIVSRDVLRPYYKAPPAPAPANPAAAAAAAAQNPGGGPGPETLRVVSLSEWMGEPEVHIRDLVNQKTMRYRPGDALAGGTIVMVDYRTMVMPGNEALKSFSRVIVKIGSEFWAIERGKTLADKYQLKLEQLPPQLSKLN
jgi:hypothetical protein